MSAGSRRVVLFSRIGLEPDASAGRSTSRRRERSHRVLPEGVGPAGEGDCSRAIPKLEEIILESERSQTEAEQRLDNDFTPQGKLTVLKHLQVYWSKDHPHRRQERRGISTTIELIHGFKLISKVVTNAALDQMADLSAEEVEMLKQESKLNLTDAQEDVEYITETWDVLDLSIGGIGARIPKAPADWVKHDQAEAV